MRLGSRLLLATALCVASCVEPNHGARMIANFESLGPPAFVNVGMGAPTLVTPHYEMWATIRKDVVVDLFSFDVAPVVDTSSPCLMYDAQAEQAYHGEVKAGELVMFPLLDPLMCQDPTCADKAWLQARAIKLGGFGGQPGLAYAVTSVSDGYASMTALDLSKCNGNDCWLDDAAILPGTFQLVHNNTPMQPDRCGAAKPMPDPGKYCLDPQPGRIIILDKTGTYNATYRAHVRSPVPQTDPTTWSNQDRLRACAQPAQKTINGAANAYYDPNYYIGNLTQLSAPHLGTLYGLVDTMDPDASLPLGGIQVVIPYQLGQASEIFLTVEDHSVGTPDSTIGNRVDPTHRGPIVLSGTTNYDNPSAGRGVMTANLVAPVNVDIAGNIPGGHVSIYNNLDDPSVQF